MAPKNKNKGKPRNYSLESGVVRFGKSKTYHKKAIYKFLKKKTAKTVSWQVLSDVSHSESGIECRCIGARSQLLIQGKSKVESLAISVPYQ